MRCRTVTRLRMLTRVVRHLAFVRLDVAGSLVDVTARILPDISGWTDVIPTAG